MSAKISINKRIIESKTDETILDSLLSEDISISYSCKRGLCGSCKCQLLSGQTSIILREEHLSDNLKEKGWILACCRNAVKDVDIRAEIINQPLPQKKIYLSRVQSAHLVTDDICQLQLRLKPNSNFEYLEGQYVDLINKHGIKRSYSISKYDASSEILEFFIKRYPDGLMSEYIFNGKNFNDLLRIEGPKGSFYLREAPSAKLCFIATGTGIAPIISMLNSSIAKKQKNKILLIWGNRYQSNFFDIELPKIKNLIFRQTLSKRASEKHFSGYVQELLFSEYRDFLDGKIYACGNQEMIFDLQSILHESNFDMFNFYSDPFYNTSNLSS